MACTYDLSDPIGQFRAIFPDTDCADPIFQDAEISFFISFEGDLRRARARALETAASNIVQTQGVVRALDLELDGAAASRELRQLAKAERDQADAADAASGGAFDWAEMVVDGWSYAERLAAESLRTLP